MITIASSLSSCTSRRRASCAPAPRDGPRRGGRRARCDRARGVRHRDRPHRRCRPRGRRVAHLRRGRAVDAPRRRPAGDHARRVRRGGGDLPRPTRASATRWRAAASLTCEHVMRRTVVGRATTATDDAGARLMRALVYVRAQRGRQPVRAPGREPRRASSTSTRARCSRSRITASSAFPPRRPTTTPRRSAGGTDLKPIEITQPEGPSFTRRRATSVRWQKWRLRVGFTAREGLVLHRSATTTAAACGRSSTAPRCREMVVPYGDPAPIQASQERLRRRRVQHRARSPTRSSWAATASARSATSTPSCSTAAASRGTIRNADLPARGGRRPALEAHRLAHRRGRGPPRRAGWCVSFIATVGNYEYGFYWYLYQDGTIELEVKLTGIMSTGGACRRARRPTHGQLLNRDGLYAPIHQHFFNVRLDLDVDGDRELGLRGRDAPTRRARTTRWATPSRPSRRC